MAQVMLMVGTRKGLFLLESDQGREQWSLRGPYCENFAILHANYDPATGTLYAVGANPWYGPAVWRSRDRGATWEHSSQGLTYGEQGPKLEHLWHVAFAHGSVYVGAEPAGLFRSDDGGESFRHIQGLRDHPTRPEWMPGNGGLCLHSIVAHPTDPQQMWVAASAVGTFYTADGGETWEARNRGIRADYMPPEKAGAEVGYCVHKIARAAAPPDPAGAAAGPADGGTTATDATGAKAAATPTADSVRLYQQSHQGVYRSEDGGRTWEWISDGLPSTFGFPLAVHPRDPNTLYVVPLNGDDAGRYMPQGAAAVWRSRDAGRNWERMSEGLPQAGVYVGVLREALAVDTLPVPGVYFGTSTGQLYGSRDEGESWAQLPGMFPRITSVEAAVL